MLWDIHKPSGTFRRLLDRDGLLLTHGRDDCDQKILSLVEIGLNCLPEVAVREFDIIFGSPVLGQKVEKTIINVRLNMP